MELSCNSEIEYISSLSYLLIIIIGRGKNDKTKQKEETFRALASIAEVYLFYLLLFIVYYYLLLFIFNNIHLTIA
jgi:hypothetical protein